MNSQSLATRAEKEVNFWKNELERAIQEKHAMQEKLQAARLDNKMMRFELLRTQQVLAELCQQNDIAVPSIWEGVNKNSSADGRNRGRTTHPQQQQQQDKAATALVRQQLTSARVQLQEAAVHMTMLEEKARVLAKDASKLQKENARLKSTLTAHGIEAPASKERSKKDTNKSTDSHRAQSPGQDRSAPNPQPPSVPTGLPQPQAMRPPSHPASSHTSEAPTDWMDVATMLMMMQKAQQAASHLGKVLNPPPAAAASLPDSSTTAPGSSSFEQYLAGSHTGTVFRSIQPLKTDWSDAGSEVSLAASLAIHTEEWKALKAMGQ